MIMKTALNWFYEFRWTAWVAGVVLGLSVLAFPPAPHHLVFGVVRDELGNPLNPTGAEVLLEAGGVLIVKSALTAMGEGGANYRLAIPLDSGVMADLYKPTALRPTVPFRMRVKIGDVTYLAIQMQGAANLLTRPGESSRVDLTLGVDSDGDGLPDAWERALIRAMGGKLTLADIRPEDDSDGDGLTNLQEYLAGTYAFDPADGFALAIRSIENDRPLLEFTVIRGRTYTVYASSDMKNWAPIRFVVPAEGAKALARDAYTATDVRLLRVTVGPSTEDESAPRFFRLIVH